MNAQPRSPIALSQVLDFLARLDPSGGRVHLTAISQDEEEIAARLFECVDDPDLPAWLDAHAGWHLYYSVNRPGPHAPNTKLRKDHLDAIRALWAEIDPRPGESLDDLLARVKVLETGPLPPSAILTSGNGVHVLYFLDTPLDAKAENGRHLRDAEDANRGLAAALGGDACHNGDRILRLPGTMNWPNARKLAKGLHGGPARLVFTSDHRYSLDEITAVYPPVAASDLSDSEPAIRAALEELDFDTVASTPPPASLAERTRAHAKAAPRFRAVLAGDLDPPPGDGTASAWRFALAIEMAGRRPDYDVNDFGFVAFAQEHFHPSSGVFTPRMLARDWARAVAAVEDRTERDRGLLGPIPDDQEIDVSAFPQIEAPARVTLSLTAFNEAVTLARTAGRKPLVKGLLDQGAMTVLYGDSNVGKTFVALLLAYHVAKGLDFAGMKTTQGHVAYIAAEGGVGVTLRAAALSKELGACPSFDFVLSPVDLFDPNADLEPLIALLRTLPDLALIVLDTFSRALAGGNENASDDMGRMVKHLDRLRAATKAHLLVVHHTGKDAAKGARGHSLLRAATDTEIEVAEGRIAVTKQRDLPRSWQSGFALKPVSLWKDEDGAAVGSAVCVLTATVETAPPGTATAREGEVLAALRACSETADNDRGGVKVEEIVEALEGSLTKVAVRVMLNRMLEKRLVARIDRGLWKPFADKTSATVDAAALLKPVIDDEDNLSGEGLFD